MEVDRKSNLSIVHINTVSSSGGAAKVARRLAEAQRCSGFRSEVLVGLKEGKSLYSVRFESDPDPFMVSRYRRKGLLDYEFRGSHELMNNKRVRDADIIHFHNLHGGYFNPFSIVLLSNIKPTVWTLHDMQSFTGHCAHSLDCEGWMEGCSKCEFLSWYPRINEDNTSGLWMDKKWIYDNSRLHIITPSNWLKEKVEKSILKNHPVDLVYNGVNTSIFKPSDKKTIRKELGLPEDAFLFGSAANGGIFDSFFKGGDYAKQIVSTLTSQRKDSFFISMGARRKSNIPNVIDLPQVTDEHFLSKVLSVLDTFIFTSIAENCPLAVLEAMACGLPIVAFNIGGVPELVREGVDGFLMAKGDWRSMVTALIKLANEPDLRKQIGINTRARVLEKFDHGVITEKYENFYREYLLRWESNGQERKIVGDYPKIILSAPFAGYRSRFEKIFGAAAVHGVPSSGVLGMKKDEIPEARAGGLDRLYQRIQEMIRGGEQNEAMEALEKLLESNPDHALAHNDLGVLYCNKGEGEKAQSHYEKAVHLEPENATFQKNLGDFYYVEAGRVEEAMELYVKILDENPTDIEVLLILGAICVSLEKSEDAKFFYERVLELDPWNVEASGKLDEQGSGQRTEGRGRTTKFQGIREMESPDELYRTAQGFMESGREKEAIGALRVFLGLYPDYALAHNDLGVLYYNEGNKEKALSHYEQAAQLEPNNLTFQENLADFYYFELERIEEALKIYNVILDENPEDLEVLLVMGHICVKLDKIDDAIGFYSRVLEIDSGNASAIEMFRQIRKMVAQFFLDKTHEDLSEHYTTEYGSTHRKILASSLKDYPLSDDEQAFLDMFTAKMNSVEKSPEAIPSLLASMLYLYPHQLPIEFDILQAPDWLQEDYCTFLLSYPRCFTKQGEVDDYCRYIKKIFASFYKSIQDAPDSKTLQKLVAIITQKAYFIPLYFSKENLKDIFHHRAAIVGLSLKTQGYALDFGFPPRSEKRKKLRLGIYSKVIAPGTEAFATLPVYEYLNREEFEVFLYVHQQNGNPVETHARQLADRFIELPENMKTSVEIIREDDLDVLFFSNNLTAVMNHAFILANHRLAHYQCVHFCQPVSSGLKHIDYFFLGDVIQEKGKEERRYHEQIVNLDGSGICFDLGNSDAQPAAAMSREQIGIPDNSLVFVSGANFFKIIPELRYLWAKLLAKVPESVLVLYPFGPEWPTSYPKSVFRGHFEKACSKYGVKEDRLIILDPLLTREDIKALLRITDVYLDAVPYSGATSLLDPLEVGVPVVVMEGEELRCRQGAAILRELGVEALVVKSEEEYLELAGRLAIDKEFRSDLREKILNRMQDMPPFLDPKGYAEKIGAALKDIVGP